MWLCSRGLGEASWSFSGEVPRKEVLLFTGRKILSIGARLWTQPHVRGKLVELCIWGGGGHRRKPGHFFGLCNPFPKHSHPTLVFQCSLSRDLPCSSTQSWVSEQTYLFFVQSSTQSKLPFPSFCSLTQTVCRAALAQGSLGWVVTPWLRQCFAPMPAAMHSPSSSLTIRKSANQSDEL